MIIDLNTKTNKSVLEDFRNKYGYNNAKEKGSEIVDITAVDNTNNPDIIALSSQDIEKIEDAWMLEEGDKMVLYIVVKDTRTVTSSNLQQTVTSSLKIYKSYDSIDNLLANLEDVGSVSEGTSDYKYRFSIAGELKGTISKWYKGLRLIALVGLLSVLVYVGIRIIISSTGQEKAKYKKMVGDWIVAICILFILHYIMAFTMTVVEDILEIFNKDDGLIISGRVVDETTGVISDPGTDVLLAAIRSEININDSYAEIGGFLVIYLVMVVYTVIFTLHYLKRLVYLAFFTMIAPLIALTYPLDKIKDGQAQAFGIWIKEYIFNALMPVMHILLYYIFVGSTMDLAKANPLYALVCIGFLIPAEKFFRKMFGFDKATTSSQLGAAAGGAMVMNAINKFGSNGQGNSNEGAGNGATGKTNGVRTQSNNPLSPYQQQQGTQQQGTQQQRSQQQGTQQQGTQQQGSQQQGSQQQSSQPLQPLQQPPQAGTQQNRGVASNVGNWIKEQTVTKPAIKRNTRKIAGAVGRIGGATLGLAAGIASGDLSKAATYTVAGWAAGGKGMEGLVNKGFGAADSAMYAGQSILKGEEYAQNKRFDRQFKESKEYRNILRNHPGSGKDVQTMLNAGITDPKLMDAILTNRKNHPTASLEQSMAFGKLASECPDSVLYDTRKLRTYLDGKNIQYDPSKIKEMQDSLLAYK